MQPKLREDIHSKISSNSVAGMFLLVKLHIDSLSTKNTISRVREALNALPEGLYRSYDIAMQRIDAQNKEDRRTAHLTIIWVANAKRPLTIKELQVALAIEPDMQQVNEENLMDIDIILSVCAGLVIVDKGSSVVRLVHYTTQEYLDSIQAQKFPDAQTEITHTLLTFLAFDGYPDSSWLPENLPPLVEYSQYCLAHAAGQPEVQLREILLEFLDKAPQWKRTPRWNSPPWDYEDWESQPSRLWISVAANLMETAKFLLDKAPVQQHSENPEIIVAAHYGHRQMICILLGKGANINAQGGMYGTALHEAAFKGKLHIVKLLLDSGAYIDTQCGGYMSALHAAILGSNAHIFEFLVGCGANVDAVLPFASFLGEEEIVRMLLQQKVDLNSQGAFYGKIFGTGLQAAALTGKLDVVQLLLHRGADVNAGGGHYGTALQAAALVGNLDIVQLLLYEGADVNAGDGQYGTALQAALYKGHVETAELLLEWNVDVNAKGDGPTALQAALYGGHVSIASILLSRNADINAKGGHYPTALQAALYGGHWPIAQLLLDLGADVNSQALQAALYGGHVAIAKSLLNKGADVKAQGGGYPTALQLALSGGHINIVPLLLEKGANVNDQGTGTPQKNKTVPYSSNLFWFKKPSQPRQLSISGGTGGKGGNDIDCGISETVGHVSIIPEEKDEIRFFRPGRGGRSGRGRRDMGGAGYRGGWGEGPFTAGFMEGALKGICLSIDGGTGGDGGDGNIGGPGGYGIGPSGSPVLWRQGPRYYR
ncbi:ankyrin repeat-containing domain protein [Mycena galopus ATCC 62051]|nr:ankyrin repeat-containing domain protein [Mycena galopus ATCC 62051]